MTKISKLRQKIRGRLDRALKSLGSAGDLLPSQQGKLAQIYCSTMGYDKKHSVSSRSRQVRRKTLLHKIASNVGTEAWLVYVQALSRTALSDEDPEDIQEIVSQWSTQNHLLWLSELSRRLWSTHSFELAVAPCGRRGLNAQGM
ncbi:hypothetical protein LTR78_003336 [Recurvomyces mirabilis]|uniref:Uncharacterized protein n=1 Tax=Recurvomyces mirabilis TaxID=574656 RepID=A0AAE1C3B0_9PEZI|nr:hypothetical protein LTR78_003336 [Recurvomyces mirabilis]KAK5149837.1 hypothetical protein LTS14_010658 [Recurvomyces mirabilis]